MNEIVTTQLAWVISISIICGTIILCEIIELISKRR